MSVHITDMQSATTDIEGLLVLTLKQVRDERGSVREFFRASAYTDAVPGLGDWRQINVTESGHGAVRGLHGEAMTKLVACVSGEAFGAYLDARPESPSYGALVTVPLSPGVQVLVPAGVCNGFQSMSEQGTQYLYCFTEEWRPGMAGTAFSPLDEQLGLHWPIPIDPADPAQISAKDAGALRFSDQPGFSDQLASR
ncbi:dTDP-4-dehydrorhamnose 3,5-epimerase family protein [Jatrophihabitans lederbergiae]|uniref:dTDP-4-dehydrorhamnose 3,5-epimerase n=1 Tax=Jatrophihabitans lederbergiae TaxID=3075547 RepID=A0ABU2J9G1_9ACTN|nr:dTDP-4-dehydrorhamnose 3,5-epimerase [Jatrophihabitans sp. DSM 44399]MDT0261381.1 dTDP-4-dehydrorhamnose 3,5-epimerase [Jatrophihabitans sp. DSM 44399]